ncbi:hypothetical protein L7F22_012859, partial [Adiantum nelumboides]|nr:hypothetical protein [Adiantum nelumboides]
IASMNNSSALLASPSSGMAALVAASELMAVSIARLVPLLAAPMAAELEAPRMAYEKLAAAGRVVAALASARACFVRIRDEREREREREMCV